MKQRIEIKLTRRHLFGILLGAIPTTVSAARRPDRLEGGTRMAGAKAQEEEEKEEKKNEKAAREGRLLARPKKIKEAAPQGLQVLGLGDKRDGLFYVPAKYGAGHAAPLAVILHGAGGNAPRAMALLQGFTAEAGLILLAPESRLQTWDIVGGKFGPDVAFIDRALRQTFSRYAVDRAHIAIGGFSDGASYALSLGLANGDLFTHVIAFSPGFIAPTRQQGAPRLFISHGKRDHVLPIDQCGRRIAAEVRRAGYDVRYREFDGPHTIPPEIAREAVGWFIKDKG
jgi:phospholipase/carboxylesterase